MGIFGPGSEPGPGLEIRFGLGWARLFFDRTSTSTIICLSNFIFYFITTRSVFFTFIFSIFGRAGFKPIFSKEGKETIYMYRYIKYKIYSHSLWYFFFLQIAKEVRPYYRSAIYIRL